MKPNFSSLQKSNTPQMKSQNINLCLKEEVKKQTEKKH